MVNLCGEDTKTEFDDGDVVTKWTKEAVKDNYYGYIRSRGFWWSDQGGKEGDDGDRWIRSRGSRWCEEVEE